MRKQIARGLAALMLATSLSATPALAQRNTPPPPHTYWEGRRDPPPGHEFRPPPPPDTRWDRRSGSPPGWDRQRWNYRQSWLRRHGHDDDDDVAGLIVGAILGFALGAAVVDSQQRQEDARSRLNDPGWIAYCARKYRSFDPYTGTYLGSDGLRHYCR